MKQPCSVIWIVSLELHQCHIQRLWRRKPGF